MPSSYPRKRFAQHWLRSEKVLNQILSAGQISPRDRILEIGPGTGILTQQLLTFAQSVIAVEIDRDLCQKLRQKYEKTDNFLLLERDVLSLNIAAELAQADEKFQHPNKVVANIPYNITGPILEKLLGKIGQPAQNPYEAIVLLLQKEVGERLVADPGSKAFGALSVRVQYLAECEYICPVPAKAFYPPPKVESAVVRLRPRRVETPAEDPRQLESLVKVGFANKRKMLRNNLKAIVDRDRLSQFLEQLEINPQSRAEDLSVRDWVALSNLLTSHKLPL
ncbi:16S rRNA (adenine(1518)-N(6)/adenine(1519)-N(6))-dimethyltransferase RsmA [Phormidium sp. CCY1219]|uniref:16S rRNA (adenine(1518)-N(6)/adenine(1519)-N(6))- dimethyltransferase RsmA n=1 Tax=Phormidium sp. CCY1219 TaxID=2886104 RepID=UPI002D1F3799|nr:16S rRNA (adenine(1518)-N(6)/adenine(1519)-N(6))-dimethyltransferase RsmA [Phormidium sp. CCY1219]MEB3829277.1 16S rRNA (adenine(1518)-N(6)/adenine(1519)-N(6))-dimethyltransferase RsmA [Phormidium sp. CCY1219]